ncbi:hypothetical protein V5N11_025773 [Cardamine amara subsp. amara]|uniref:DUF1985 domain-containing protein n=1 Tax=Cardamine amara subsp. amara TaxID=228776 RepID=A0ABD1C892_CARAN
MTVFAFCNLRFLVLFSCHYCNFHLICQGLASSSALCQYPPQLLGERKSSIHTHNMNHYSAMANLAKVRKELGAYVWSRLKEPSIGVFAKFADLDYTWTAKRVHYLLVNQLLVDDPHEIWSLIDDRPIRFSLHEFRAFTGLICDTIPSDVCSLSRKEFWWEMEISIAIGLTFEELECVMARSHLWSLDKRVMVAQLCLLSVAVHT